MKINSLTRVIYMICVAGKRNDLNKRLVDGLGKYRNEVFIKRLGWPLNSVDDIESDEFDGPDSIYVSSFDLSGQVNGVARLLPTTVPYLLKEHFSNLWGDSSLPRDSEIFELSRFAAVDLAEDKKIQHQATAHHASKLFRYVAEIARGYGARMLVTVSPVGMKRLLRLNGFRVLRSGPVMRCGNDAITSLLIDLSSVRSTQAAY